MSLIVCLAFVGEFNLMFYLLMQKCIISAVYVFRNSPKKIYVFSWICTPYVKTNKHHSNTDISDIIKNYRTLRMTTCWCIFS